MLVGQRICEDLSWVTRDNSKSSSNNFCANDIDREHVNNKGLRDKLLIIVRLEVSPRFVQEGVGVKKATLMLLR